MNTIWMLAQADAAKPQDAQDTVVSEKVAPSTTTTGADGKAATAPGETQKPLSIFQQPQFWLLGVMLIMVYFLMFRAPKKRQEQQQKMVQALKPNDRVQTIGGVLGTVVRVESDRILVKVDESNNTKIWFIPGAIHKLASDDGN